MSVKKMVLIGAVVLAVLGLVLVVGKSISSKRDVTTAKMMVQCRGTNCDVVPAPEASSAHRLTPDELAQRTPLEASLAYFEDYYRQMYAFEVDDDYFVAFEPFDIETSDDGTQIVYLWAFGSAYGVEEDGAAHRHSSGHVPARFVVKDGVVTSLERPLDTPDWLEQVHTIFPPDVAEKIGNFDRSTLMTQMDALVTDYYAHQQPAIPVGAPR